MEMDIEEVEERAVPVEEGAVEEGAVVEGALEVKEEAGQVEEVAVEVKEEAWRVEEAAAVRVEEEAHPDMEGPGKDVSIIGFMRRYYVSYK